MRGDTQLFGQCRPVGVFFEEVRQFQISVVLCAQPSPGRAQMGLASRCENLRTPEGLIVPCWGAAVTGADRALLIGPAPLKRLIAESAV
jgi:hypothetical protein